ncbi:hypothetical protein BpHYR1_028873 [Brachionus plicatilis]|uniref:Uncharacterized protein n=1 Tax=Brachionus plicatilis TaxID=10195 RepID=A0A3M7PWQ9_BRAPC|nr:hypothetical protein BpHYR1_028873 [Brachionus plicatilis]
MLAGNKYLITKPSITNITNIYSQIPNLYRILKRKVLISGSIKEPKTYNISDLFFSFQSSNDVYNVPMDITKKLNVELKIMKKSKKTIVSSNG